MDYPFSPAQLIEFVANATGADSEGILSHLRTEKIVEARAICAWLLHNNFGMGHSKIGEALGGKDRSAIYYMLDKVEKRFLTDRLYRLFVKGLEEQVELHRRLAVFKGLDHLKLARQVSSSRRAAMMVSSDAIMGLGAMICSMNEVCEASVALTQHLQEEDTDQEAVAALCVAIQDEMAALCGAIEEPKTGEVE